jgi:hypothetical protein
MSLRNIYVRDFFLKAIHSFIGLSYVFYITRFKKTVIFFILQPANIKFIESLYSALNDTGSFNTCILTTGFSRNFYSYREKHFYIAPRLITLIKGDCVVSSNTGVPKHWINGFKNRIHTFHSPISTHRIFGENAFMAFNTFFVAGIHQKEEIISFGEPLFPASSKIFETGYLPIDNLQMKLRENTELKAGKQTDFRVSRKVMIAPSWGPENLVESGCWELISQLLAAEYQVVLRPHPGNFVYNKTEIERILTSFGSNQNFTLDDKFSDDCHLVSSSLLIGDWSGISFEFASAFCRPVLFINTRQKDFGALAADQKDSMPCFENHARERYGIVIESDEIANIVSYVDQIKANYQSFEQKILESRAYDFYNIGSVAKEMLIAITEIFDADEISEVKFDR